MPIRSLVMVPNVRTSLCPGVITHATTDFLCTSSPAHLSCTISIATISINGGLVGDGYRLDQDIPLRSHTRCGHIKWYLSATNLRSSLGLLAPKARHEFFPTRPVRFIARGAGVVAPRIGGFP